MDGEKELEPQSKPSRDELDALIGLHHSQPQVRAVNQIVGIADELGRIVAASVIGLVVLVALAATVSPWFWLGVAVWVGYAVATIVWLRRRRRPPQRRLPAPRE